MHGKFFRLSVNNMQPLASMRLSDNLGLSTKLCSMADHNLNVKVIWWKTQPVKRITEGRKAPASRMEMLWHLAALLSSSPHSNSGTRMVTSTFASFAKCIARVLFTVDKPPLDDPHSFARRVTFSTRRSERACAVSGDDDGGHASCEETKIAYFKYKFYIWGFLTFWMKGSKTCYEHATSYKLIAQQQSKTAH